MTREEFATLVGSRPVILDGATGTNLQKAGMPVGVCPEQWILENPGVLIELQERYVEAGTDILFAPTFTASRIKLEEYGLENSLVQMNRELVALSKRAAGGRAYVAGDLTMTGRQLYPLGDLMFEDLKKKNVLYTGNYMVDAIINGIIAKEAYSDVKFHCEGKLPRKLMIQDVDLSGLLSNGLENAAEACLHSNGDKCVLFKAASYENMIHFEIKNTYDSTRYKALSKGDFETTKKDSEYHGYGIESMRRIVKKYDGKLEYIVEPEWVITDIYLQQKDEI
mgnify:CR=1 FL=1